MLAPPALANASSLSHSHNSSTAPTTSTSSGPTSLATSDASTYQDRLKAFQTSQFLGAALAVDGPSPPASSAYQTQVTSEASVNRPKREITTTLGTFSVDRALTKLDQLGQKGMIATDVHRAV